MKKEEKLQQILQTAEALFKRYGLKRVPVDEICEKANVSKMTFYKYFPNKIELAKVILQNLAERQKGQYASIMKEEIPYSEKVRQIIRMKLEQTEDISQEFLAEIWQDKEPEIAEFIQKIVDDSFKIFFADLRQAKQKGNIREDIKPEFIIFMLNEFIEMVKDGRLITLYPSAKAMIAELTNFFFYGILPREGKEGK